MKDELSFPFDGFVMFDKLPKPFFLYFSSPLPILVVLPVTRTSNIFVFSDFSVRLCR